LKYLLLLFFSVLYLSAVGHASSVSGFVFDESDGESLTGANIFFEKISFGAISNNSGYYVVSDLPAGKYLLHCSYVGYRDYSIEIELKENQNFKLMIQLKPALMETEAVVVSADSVRTAVRLFRKAISRIDISPAEIKTMPAVAETDLLRMLQSLPGILPISDFSSKIYVRGGTSDQNLYLIDGADVYNPEHAFGLFSTFNTDAVKDIKISKGGFAAEYGGRLSSVLDVTNLDGNRKSFGVPISVKQPNYFTKTFPNIIFTMATSRLFLISMQTINFRSVFLRAMIFWITPLLREPKGRPLFITIGGTPPQVCAGRMYLPRSCFQISGLHPVSLIRNLM